MTTSRATLWTNVVITRKGDLRVITFNSALVQNKITLSAGDRPASAVLGCGISGDGFATAITVHANGTIEFANTNGYYTNGGIRGQVVYAV